MDIVNKSHVNRQLYLIKTYAEILSKEDLYLNWDVIEVRLDIIKACDLLKSAMKRQGLV